MSFIEPNIDWNQLLLTIESKSLVEIMIVGNSGPILRTRPLSFAPPPSFFPGFDGTIPESPATTATPADGAGEVVSGSCGCMDGYIPERNEDSELVMCRCVDRGITTFGIWVQSRNIQCGAGTSGHFAMFCFVFF